MPGGGDPGRFVASSSLIDQNHEVGVAASGSEVELTATVVRRTLAEAQTGLFGRGLDVAADPVFGAPSLATLTVSLIEQNRGVGVMVFDSELAMETSVVRDTQPTDADGDAGWGIGLQATILQQAQPTATVVSSLLEGNHGMGISSFGYDVTVDATVVRGTLPEIVTGRYGRGIGSGISSTGEPDTVALRWSVIADNHEMGVFAIDGDFTIEASLVTGTRKANDLFGDGVAVLSLDTPASLLVSSSRVESSARAGAACFGAFLRISDTTLDCNPIQLAGESLPSQPFTFEDLGNNACRCGEQLDNCKVLSSGIEPPQPLAEQ